MNSYQREHEETFRIVAAYLKSQPPSERKYLLERMEAYVDFRTRLDAFQRTRIGGLCGRKCFQTGLSACCPQDSIIVYFADVVVECIYSGGADIQEIITLLSSRNKSRQCVYLTPAGCRWRTRPIVCAMFLCDEAESLVRNESEYVAEQWLAFERERKLFTWPDQPVLFDMLEEQFLRAGLSSPLMHLHTSPGLLALKQKAGLLKNIPAARLRQKR